MIWRSYFVHCVPVRISTLAVLSWHRNETTDLGEIVCQASVGDAAESLGELTVSGKRKSRHRQPVSTVSVGHARARSRWRAALIRERCVKAWGKLPRASPLGPISSA